jgi:hypothetical protein
MSNPKLSRLERVDIREVWTNESASFTPWLALEENLELLSEAIGIDLEFEAKERAIGPLSADLLCKDANSGAWVLIENQLGRTDHLHLGQIITYAAGLEAATLVWVAPQFNDEHRSALDWLNRVACDRFGFFGVEVEAWRIGSSAPAPRFQVVSRPNAWSRSATLASRALDSAGLSPAQQIKLDYWSAWREFAQNAGLGLRTQKPSPSSWTSVSLGRNGFRLDATVSMREHRIGVSLVLSSDRAKEMFTRLEESRAEIEREIGSPLLWQRLPDKKESRIELFREETDPADRSDWRSQHRWLCEVIERFSQEFGPRLREIGWAAATYA